MSDDTEELPQAKRAVADAARRKALVLYDGKVVPHHSCGIAVAATFSLPTSPYQSLRRGGITGCGRCGAIRGGEQVLGELLGDPDPTGAVTDELRAAISWYQDRVEERIDRGPARDYVCNNLTGQFAEFRSPERHQFCTNLTAQVAELTAEAALRFGPAGDPLTIEPIAQARAEPASSKVAAGGQDPEESQ